MGHAPFEVVLGGTASVFPPVISSDFTLATVLVPFPAGSPKSPEHLHSAQARVKSFKSSSGGSRNMHPVQIEAAF